MRTIPSSCGKTTTTPCNNNKSREREHSLELHKQSMEYGVFLNDASSCGMNEPEGSKVQD